MKEVYLIRHAEKDPNGILTERGEMAAQELAKVLPVFSKVVSSDSSRTQRTAELLTGKKPEIDDRAGFAMASPQKSDDINRLAAENNTTFFEASKVYNDAAVLAGIDVKAKGLKALVTELLGELGEGEKALVVSHDLSITPAVALDGLPATSIDFLHGYVIHPGEKPLATDLRTLEQF